MAKRTKMTHDEFLDRYEQSILFKGEFRDPQDYLYHYYITGDQEREDVWRIFEHTEEPFEPGDEFMLELTPSDTFWSAINKIASRVKQLLMNY